MTGSKQVQVQDTFGSSSSTSMNPAGNGNGTGTGRVGLLSLPREVLGLIAEHIYDPLILTQQDRLSTYPSPAVYSRRRQIGRARGEKGVRLTQW